MNRIELISVFKALEILGREKNIDGIMELVETVLDEAQQVKPSKENDKEN
ncbi:MAG: hypothetical protein FWG44_04495 [Oscillospiraceae bacterium]|nr:hypothetical protein [Oscillospiraceae bacterium]